MEKVAFHNKNAQYTADEIRKRIEWDSRGITGKKIAEEPKAETTVKDTAEPESAPKTRRAPKDDGREAGYVADCPPSSGATALLSGDRDEEF